MNRTLRWAAWFCVVLIAYLSLTPVQMRTPAPAGVEHAIAYAGTAGLMVLAYPSRSVWSIVGLLVVYSGVMELLQNFSPGRYPGLDGVLSSSAGAVVGGGSGKILTRAWASCVEPAKAGGDDRCLWRRT